jgi:hypothetical protein
MRPFLEANQMVLLQYAKNQPSHAARCCEVMIHASRYITGALEQASRLASAVLEEDERKTLENLIKLRSVARGEPRGLGNIRFSGSDALSYYYGSQRLSLEAFSSLNNDHPVKSILELFQTPEPFSDKGRLGDGELIHLTQRALLLKQYHIKHLTFQLEDNDIAVLEKLLKDLLCVPLIRVNIIIAEHYADKKKSTEADERMQQLCGCFDDLETRALKVGKVAIGVTKAICAGRVEEEFDEGLLEGGGWSYWEEFRLLISFAIARRLQEQLDESEELWRKASAHLQTHHRYARSLCSLSLAEIYYTRARDLRTGSGNAYLISPCGRAYNDWIRCRLGELLEESVCI